MNKTRSGGETAERSLSALDAIYGRRSVRSYTPHKLEKSTVRALLDAAVQAPTAMHQQPWVFAVIQDHRVLKQLSDRVKAMWAQEARPPRELHIRHGDKLHAEFIERLADPAFNVFYDAGTLVMVGARRIDPFITADCWLAAENLMLAACALGLGTCCIGAAVAAINEPDTRMLLGIPADVTVLAPVVVGVPDEVATPMPRAEPQIVSWK